MYSTSILNESVDHAKQTQVLNPVKTASEKEGENFLLMNNEI